MVHTRNSNKEELQYNPELELTLFRIRKELRNNFLELPFAEKVEGEMAQRENRTLREFTSPNIDEQTLCITYQQADEGGTFELKSGLIHLLPSFHGSNGEDTNKFLSEFQVVCGGMRPNGATKEKVKLRAFSFALKNAAKDWLYYLPPGCVTTWAEMKKRFLEKYFPASK